MSIKPSTHEETYFTQKGVFENVTNTKVLEREEQKLLHWMRCPKCGSELTEMAYRDQCIDRCEACGGIWLDAGELEAMATKEDGFLAGLRKVFQG